MTVEEALEFVESLLQTQGKRSLNDVQRAIFRGSWLGQTYERIYEQSQLSEHCSIEHLKRNVGPELWQLLTGILAEKASKKGLQGAIERAEKRHTQPSKLIPDAPPVSPPGDPQQEELQGLRYRRPPESWSNAPDTSNFHGREQALATVKHWLTLEGCRLVLVYGIKGIGKTLFATKLAREVQPQFEWVVWRSLSNWHSRRQSPTAKQLLADLLAELMDLPSHKAHPSELLRYLQQHRCLIVLDGLESVLSSSPVSKSFLAHPAAGKAFSEFLEALSSVPHKSCLLLTSQEEPQEIARIKGEQILIRSLRLQGLGDLAAREMLLTKGNLTGSESDWRRFMRHCEGHPLLLNGVASTILTICNGNIATFLEQFAQSTLEEVRQLLKPSLERLDATEQAICRYLHQQGEPTIAQDIVTGLWSAPHQVKLPLQEITKALEKLERKSLVAVDQGYYWLHPLVLRSL